MNDIYINEMTSKILVAIASRIGINAPELGVSGKHDRLHEIMQTTADVAALRQPIWDAIKECWDDKTAFVIPHQAAADVCRQGTKPEMVKKTVLNAIEAVSEDLEDSLEQAALDLGVGGGTAETRAVKLTDAKAPGPIFGSTEKPRNKMDEEEEDE
jgi:hypothetical protein